MKKMNDAEIGNLLKESLPQHSAELTRDLWPQMLRRMDGQLPAATVPWFDWALIGALFGCGLAFPGLIPVLLYHL